MPLAFDINYHPDLSGFDQKVTFEEIAAAARDEPPGPDPRWTWMGEMAKAVE